MKAMFHKVAERFAKRSGQSLVEYTLVLALVVIVCVAAVTLLGTRTSTKVGTVAGQLQ